MVQKKKKNKSHGKPSTSKAYKENASLIGIDLDTYGPRRPRPIPVYKIYCHFRKTLDHSKYHWARQEKYAEDAYINKSDINKICSDLETRYPDWLFTSIMEFVDPSTQINKTPADPMNIIYNIKESGHTILSHINKDYKSKTDAHKKQILEENNITEESTEKSNEKPKKKTRKTKKI